jgi:hypothetical protein
LTLICTWSRPPACSLAQQQLVVAHAVEIAGIEQGHAGVHGGADGGQAFGAVGRTVQVGHAHQAQAELCDLRAGAAQFAGLHHVLQCVGESRCDHYAFID